MKYDEVYEDGRSSSPAKWAFIGSIVGVLGMYFFDPEKGSSRRIQFKQKIFDWTRNLQQYSGTKLQGVKSQFRGLEAGLNQIQNTATNAPIRTSKSKNRDQSFN